MWIVALDAVHFAFQDWMVLRQVERCFDIGVALETRSRVLARIDDEAISLKTSGIGDVLAAWAVA